MHIALWKVDAIIGIITKGLYMAVVSYARFIK